MEKKIEFNGRARYCIVIQGQPSVGFMRQFGDVQIHHHTTDSGDEETHLQIEILDQTHLSGILNTLYAQHLSLKKVVWIRTDEVSKKNDV